MGGLPRQHGVKGWKTSEQRPFCCIDRLLPVHSGSANCPRFSWIAQKTEPKQLRWSSYLVLESVKSVQQHLAMDLTTLEDRLVFSTAYHGSSCCASMALTLPVPARIRELQRAVEGLKIVPRLTRNLKHVFFFVWHAYACKASRCRILQLGACSWCLSTVELRSTLLGVRSGPCGSVGSDTMNHPPHQ